MNKDLQLELLEKYNAGAMYKDLEEEYGIVKETIRYHLKKFPNRRRGRVKADPEILRQRRNIRSREYLQRPEVKERRRIVNQQWRDNNRESYNESQRKYRDRHRDQQKASQLKFHYDISLEEYQKLYQKSGGLCEICKIPPGDTRGTELHLDHNHLTGKPRGILCPNCNRGLGIFQDNPDLLIKASEYLVLSNTFLLKEK